ncbi:MAG: T9SS type A sorting domain-containing protein [Bacteroidetes bacterium]|nr:T9SS type A sorting domain-containing protein [Bacteroidota bacterium]
MKKIIIDTLSALGILPEKNTPNPPPPPPPPHSNNELTIFPNPIVRGSTFRLSWNTDPGKYRLTLFTPTGILVQEQTVQVDNNAQTTSWNIPPRMPAGIYIIRVIRPGGTGIYARELVVE